MNYEQRELIVKDKKPLEVAMTDVSKLLKIRGLNLDCFEVNIMVWMDEWYRIFLAIKGVLESIGILSAKSVLINWDDTYEIAELLQHVKPEVLEDLTIKCLGSERENLVGLEQWKKAKNLKLSKVPHFSIIVKHLNHFKSMNFDFVGESFSRDDIIKFRDEVLLKSTNFEYFTSENVKFSARLLVKVFDLHSTPSSSGSIVYKSKNGTFDIAYHPNGFTIKKKIDSNH